MRVAVATERDADAVVEMLKKSFFPLEPLNASIGLLEADGGCPALEQYCRSAVPSGLSLCLWDAEGALAGVVLNTTLQRRDVPGPEDAEVRDGASKFDKILAVNHAVERAADVFAARPDLDRVLDIKILATDPARGRQGVATTLVERTVELARARGLPLVRCVCSGAYSARAAARCGFTRLGGIPYDQFLGADGAPVFRPPPPHTEISVWTLDLQSC